jgi:hypothetical protein
MNAEHSILPVKENESALVTKSKSVLKQSMSSGTSSLILVSETAYTAPLFSVKVPVKESGEPTVRAREKVPRLASSPA